MSTPRLSPLGRQRDNVRPWTEQTKVEQRKDRQRNARHNGKSSKLEPSEVEQSKTELPNSKAGLQDGNGSPASLHWPFRLLGLGP